MGKVRELEAKIEELQYELRKYKKAVLTRDNVIEQMKLDIAANFDVQQMLSAYICYLIDSEGGVARIPREEITKRIGKYSADISLDGEDYLIRIEKSSDKVGDY